MPDTIVYDPCYMPTTSANWRRRDEDPIDETFGYVKRVNNAYRIDAKAGRLLCSQPVCPPDFAAMIQTTQSL